MMIIDKGTILIATRDYISVGGDVIITKNNEYVTINERNSNGVFTIIDNSGGKYTWSISSIMVGGTFTIKPPEITLKEYLINKIVKS